MIKKKNHILSMQIYNPYHSDTYFFVFCRRSMTCGYENLAFQVIFFVQQILNLGLDKKNIIIIANHKSKY
jgi:hypothetical protein